jgi:hypothetical protein
MPPAGATRTFSFQPPRRTNASELAPGFCARPLPRYGSGVAVAGAGVSASPRRWTERRRATRRGDRQEAEWQQSEDDQRAAASGVVRVAGEDRARSRWQALATWQSRQVPCAGRGARAHPSAMPRGRFSLGQGARMGQRDPGVDGQDVETGRHGFVAEKVCHRPWSNPDSLVGHGVMLIEIEDVDPVLTVPVNHA